MNGDGLFGTVGTRSIDATTSAAVNSLPSWNLTPRAQLELPRHRVDRLPLGREARLELRLLVALDQVAEEVRRNVVVRRQVVIVRIDRRDVGAEPDGEIGGGRRERQRAATQRRRRWRRSRASG